MPSTINSGNTFLQTISNYEAPHIKIIPTSSYFVNISDFTIKKWLFACHEIYSKASVFRGAKQNRKVKLFYFFQNFRTISKEIYF